MCSLKSFKDPIPGRANSLTPLFLIINREKHAFPKWLIWAVKWQSWISQEAGDGLVALECVVNVQNLRIAQADTLWEKKGKDLEWSKTRNALSPRLRLAISLFPFSLRVVDFSFFYLQFIRIRMQRKTCFDSFPNENHRDFLTTNSRTERGIQKFFWKKKKIF